MTAWADRQQRAAQERDHARQQALAVLCTEPDCGAGVGEQCRNVRTRLPLEHQVAHMRRIRAGEERAHRLALLERERNGGVHAQQ